MPQFPGKVTVGNGSESLPSVAAISDLNTGMYFGGDDTIRFSAGGDEGTRITPDGLQIGAYPKFLTFENQSCHIWADGGSIVLSPDWPNPIHLAGETDLNGCQIKNLADGTGAQDAVNLGQLSAAVTGIARVTSLPGSPTDGQTISYAPNGDNGPEWLLRYHNAGSVYKWKVIGGSRVTSTSADKTVTTSGTPNTFVAFSSGPTFTIPAAGDYDFEYWSPATVHANATPAIVFMALRINGVAVSSAVNYLENGKYQSIFGRFRTTGLSAGHVCDLAHAASIASLPTLTFSTPWLSVMPVRL